MLTINCKGKILSLADPLIMGIINATPDSFYQGHLDEGIPAMVLKAEQMLSEGADILDVGGQSSRPGSQRISVDEELERVLPLIGAIHEKIPGTIISIDTYYSSVALAAVAAGASIVNDISAGSMDESMLGTVASLHVPYVCMHMKGNPATMQLEAVYEDVVKEVLDFFISKVDSCLKAGIRDVIIDPGFGFGKSIEQNFRLLRSLELLSITGKPILAGLSRKSTIYKTLGITPAEALNGTTTLNTIALLNGASILRVHDVRAAKEAVLLFNAYKKAPQI